MKLTLTREQIPLARETVAFIRSKPGEQAALQSPERRRGCPGWRDWYDLNVKDGEWASALEAAIAEAEDKDAEGPQPGPVSDADERAFWREAFTLDYAQPSSWCGADRARYSVQAADVALAGYRAAFCTGMPSDQKGVER